MQLILKGNQHNWYRRIVKKIRLKLTMSSKEWGFYREILRDNGLEWSSDIFCEIASKEGKC